MFTGIVEELGEVVALEAEGGSARLTIRGAVVTSDVRRGDSIAVNGCCLTVVEHTDDTFSADVMAETLDRTTIGDLSSGSPVNLERAVTPMARLGGHLVQGHVDGVGRIVERERTPHWDVVTIAVPPELMRYVALKGSVAVDGVSLTVCALDDGGPPPARFETPREPTLSVSLIPTTLELTTLGGKGTDDLVNIEVDVVAKYVERLLAAEPAPTPLRHKDG
jgi:riboflavin synthase